MHGEKISQLAHDAKLDEKCFKTLMGKVTKITNKVVRKYSSFADKNEILSICYTSMIQSVRTFDKDKGLFEPHYLRRAMVEVKRELLKNSLIKMPEAIVNLSSKMSVEDREALIKIPVEYSIQYDAEKYSILYKTLAAKYNTTVRQIKKVRDIKYVVSTLGSFVMDGADTDDRFSTCEIEAHDNIRLKKINEVLQELDERARDVILLHFGIVGGQPLPFTKIAEKIEISVEDVKNLYKMGIEYLQSDNIKSQLEGLL